MKIYFVSNLLLYSFLDDKMLEMVALQEINGSWPLTTEVVSLLGVSEETLAKSFAMKVCQS